MEEKILAAFKELGFQLEDMEDLGYGFRYEGKHFLYMKSENDPEFLNITVPAVIDIDDKDDINFYKMMDQVNGTLKYVKAYELNDSMWLFYERELTGDEDLKKVLKNMILRLDNGYNFLNKNMSDAVEDNDNVNKDEDDSDNDIENTENTSIEESVEDTNLGEVDEDNDNNDNHEDDV